MICCNYLEMFNIQLIHVARHMHSMTIRPGRQSRHHSADHWRVAAGAGHWALAAVAGGCRLCRAAMCLTGQSWRLGDGEHGANRQAGAHPGGWAVRAQGRRHGGTRPGAEGARGRCALDAGAAPRARTDQTHGGEHEKPHAHAHSRRQDDRAPRQALRRTALPAYRPPAPPLAAFPSPPFGLFRQVLSWSAARAWQTLPTCCRQRHSQRHSQRHMQRHSQRHSEMPCCKGFAAWLRHSQRHAMRHAQRHAPQHIYIIIIIIIHR